MDVSVALSDTSDDTLTGLPTIANAIELYQVHGTNNTYTLLKKINIDEDGNSTTIQLENYNEAYMKIRAYFIGFEGYLPSTSNLISIPVLNDSQIPVSLVMEVNPNAIGMNWIGSTPCTATISLQDAYGNLLGGEDVTFRYGVNNPTTHTIESNGIVTVEFAPSSSDIENNVIPVSVEYEGHTWDGSVAYASATTQGRILTSGVVLYDTSLSLAHSYSGGDTINLSDLTSATIPVTATLVTDDTDLSSQYALSGQTVVFRCSDGVNTTTLGTATTNSNGVATANLPGLPTPTSSSITIIASFTDSNNQYGNSSSSILFNINDDTTPVVTVDPLSDSLLFDITNWGTYPSGSSGSGLTGTTTPATTSDLTINLQNKTITDQNQKYFVYNYTLQDFWDYYGDEFSIIAYKTGGDGRYDLGFLNTTTGGYKLGYGSGGNAINQENNISQSEGEVKYQRTTTKT